MIKPDSTTRVLLGVSSTAVLVCSYLLQDSVNLPFMQVLSPDLRFACSKTGRFIFNDLLMLGVIFSIFADRKIMLLALLVQLVGTLFLFLPYLILKIVFHLDDGPLVSFLHRITVNPLLLVVLIPAIWIQRRYSSISNKIN
jgi:exosortase F-associated protein